MPDDAPPKPALAFHHNQLVIMLSGFIVSAFVNYMIVRDQLTTLNVKFEQFEKDKTEMKATMAKEAEINRQYREAMKEAVVKMQTIMEERKK